MIYVCMYVVMNIECMSRQSVVFIETTNQYILTLAFQDSQEVLTSRNFSPFTIYILTTHFSTLYRIYIHFAQYFCPGSHELMLYIRTVCTRYLHQRYLPTNSFDSTRGIDNLLEDPSLLEIIDKICRIIAVEVIAKVS